MGLLIFILLVVELDVLKLNGGLILCKPVITDWGRLLFVKHHDFLNPGQSAEGSHD